MFTIPLRDDCRSPVYAIGDVSEAIPTEGRMLYRAVFTKDLRAPGPNRPMGGVHRPQIGVVGLTEQEARSGYEVGVGRQDFADQGTRRRRSAKRTGFVKRVTNAETDELLGAHIVGEQGAEIVHELVLAIELGATADDIANTMHIHPTLPESINSAAGGVETLENIDFVEGHGIFESPQKFASTIEPLRAETIVINAGARPTRPSIDGLDDVDVHDSTDLLERASIPPHWPSSAVATSAVSTPRCTAGSGRTSPSSSAATSLLPDEDPDVSVWVIETASKTRNHRPDRYAVVTALTETNDGIRVDAGADGTVSVTASDVALAAGRTPNTDGLQLRDIGASLDENGFVETDDRLQNDC